MVSGVDAPVELARILCGIETELRLSEGKYCTYRFFDPAGCGVIEKIEKATVSNNPNVLDYRVTAKVGDKYLGLYDSMQRIGYVLTCGTSREEASVLADDIDSATNFIFDT